MWVFAGLALICFLMFGYLLVTIPNPMLERDMPKEYADSIPRLAVFYITGMVLGPFLTMAAGSWLVKQHRQSSDLDELPHDV